MRALLFALAASLVLALAAAPSASAAIDPVGGCGDDALVETCQPVCIQSPCAGYVCVHGPVDRCFNR